jgi:hypothetical protein
MARDRLRWSARGERRKWLIEVTGAQTPSDHAGPACPSRRPPRLKARPRANACVPAANDATSPAWSFFLRNREPERARALSLLGEPEAFALFHQGVSRA